MNRNATHKIFLLALALLLVSVGTLHAGKKPKITRHDATLLQNVIKITVEWQAEKPVVLLKATAGGQSNEVELDEYDDNTRDRHGFYGEADVSILLEPYEAFVQKDYIPYVIQIRDDLGRKSELTGRVRVRVQEEEGRYQEAGGGYPGGVQVRTDDSGEYKTKHIIRDVLEIVKQHTAQRDNRDHRAHRDSDYGSGQYAPNMSADPAKPVISLIEGEYVTVEVGTPYKEPGATAVDKDGTDISGSIVTTYFKDDQKVSGLDTSEVGVCYASYDVTDQYGNSALTVYRAVEVVDSSAPVIELKGENPLTVFVGKPYQEFGAIVKDSEGKEIAGFDKIETSYWKWKLTAEEVYESEYAEKIATDEAGAYSVMYSFTYDGDKSVDKQRDLEVVDSGAPPVITLLPEGNADVTVDVGKQYKDPGFKANDKDGNDITQKVKTDGYVDTNNTGTYYVYYDVVDDYGIAAATVYRIVYVEDSTTADVGDSERPGAPGTGKFREFPPPRTTKGPQEPPAVVRWKGMPPPTVSTTQGIPPKLPPSVISATPQTKKKTRVYYKAKLPPTGSTVIKAGSPKLPPGGITSKPGAAPQATTQPSDDKKKPDEKKMKPLW